MMTLTKVKEGSAIDDAWEAVSVASVAGEIDMHDVGGMEKIQSAEQPVVEQISNAAHAEHISNADEASSITVSGVLDGPASKGAIVDEFEGMTDAPCVMLRDAVSTTTTNETEIKSYVDIINMSAHVCLGYRLILRVMDPVARVGHATILKSDIISKICDRFQHLMLITCVPPKEVYYDDKFSCLASLQDMYPETKLIHKPHSNLMK